MTPGHPGLGLALRRGRKRGGLEPSSAEVWGRAGRVPVRALLQDPRQPINPQGCVGIWALSGLHHRRHAAPSAPAFPNCPQPSQTKASAACPPHPSLASSSTQGSPLCLFNTTSGTAACKLTRWYGLFVWPPASSGAPIPRRPVKSAPTRRRRFASCLYPGTRSIICLLLVPVPPATTTNTDGRHPRPHHNNPSPPWRAPSSPRGPSSRSWWP